MDFTLRQYGRLLQLLKDLRYPVYPIGEWVRLNPDRGVFLRHDVDRLPSNALRMARLEMEMGVRSTYYFRIGRQSFRPAIISDIHGMGHEIGYHYEDLSLARGNPEKAISLFRDHLEKLRKHAPIETIAMHGRPFSRYDNRDLWKKYDFGDFGIKAEAFLTIDYSDVHYFTDTGRDWSGSSPNFRDKVNSRHIARTRTTEDLMQFMENHPNQKIGLVIHPERWNAAWHRWLGYAVFDLGVNLAKKTLRLVHP